MIGSRLHAGHLFAGRLFHHGSVSAPAAVPDRLPAGRLLAGRLFAGRLFNHGAVAAPVAVPDYFPAGRLRPGQKSRLRHAARAGVLLSVGCSVASSARLSLGANATVNADFSLKSKSTIRFGSHSEVAVCTAVSAVADVHDVVLELLLFED